MTGEPLMSAERVQTALQEYASGIRSIRLDPNHHPETSLYTKFEEVLREIAKELGLPIEIIQQYTAGEAGAPDFGIKRPRFALIGHIEAKEPEKNLDHLTGRDRQQFERYLDLPNWILTNFWELRLYQDGKLVDRAELVPKVALDPARKKAVVPHHDPHKALFLLEAFLRRSPSPIKNAAQLCAELARSARLVRAAVCDALESPDSGNAKALRQVFDEFKDALFSDLDEAKFADAYAQTLAYGLLLARKTTGKELELESAHRFVDEMQHRLLSATLRLLAQPEVTRIIGWTTRSLIDLVNRVDPAILLVDRLGRDPILYFYEDFLAAYDEALRKQAGVYYTPPPVVNFQTRCIQRLLREVFGKPLGFADDGVEVLDPAVGTGTYLVSALKEGAQAVESAMGEGAVPQYVSSMLDHLHGFELLVGPYTVAHFRQATAAQELGGSPSARLPIFLTDTLEPAHTKKAFMGSFGFMSAPITEERQETDHVKSEVPIMVILGNPPYGRGKAISGWVWEELLEDFRKQVPKEERVNLKNLAEKYVYFYRWATWKLFEQDSSPKRGILSFISNRSFLEGGAFSGMRAMFRKRFERIFVIDLHGNKRPALPAHVARDENVFPETQVGITITFCIAGGKKTSHEAEVYYTEVWGDADQKDQWLNRADLSTIEYVPVEGQGIDPFLPSLTKVFGEWPELKGEVFRKAFSGIETNRDSFTVAPDPRILEHRFGVFKASRPAQRREIFHESRDRGAGAVAALVLNKKWISRYGYRPLDRQFFINHRAFIDWTRPSLQKAWGDKNVAIATLPKGHGTGPVVFAHCFLPDRHCFRGSYGGHIFPLWIRDGAQEETDPNDAHNFRLELVQALQKGLRKAISADEFFAFCYAVLACEAYSRRFGRDLARSFPRVPFPKSTTLFSAGAALGKRLLALHTFEESYPNDGSIGLEGKPKTIGTPEYLDEPQVLLIGENARIRPVTPDAWGYQVSGYEVLRQWLERREALSLDRRMIRELFNVIWALEQTVAMRQDLETFLES
ncbi:MAG: type ISP restriction/modification enzyme, partial [Nitrospinota bacterium]